jgi:hypothetical protein
MSGAKTLAEAQQPYQVPQNINDRTDAYLADGYAIANELGFDLREWGAAKEQNFHQTGEWELDELGVRLMLFYQDRALHFGGYTGHEFDYEIDTLLQKLAQLKATDYQPINWDPQGFTKQPGLTLKYQNVGKQASFQNINKDGTAADSGVLIDLDNSLLITANNIAKIKLTQPLSLDFWEANTVQPKPVVVWEVTADMRTHKFWFNIQDYAGLIDILQHRGDINIYTLDAQIKYIKQLNERFVNSFKLDALDLNAAQSKLHQVVHQAGGLKDQMQNTTNELLIRVVGGYLGELLVNTGKASWGYRQGKYPELTLIAGSSKDVFIDATEYIKSGDSRVIATYFAN